MIELKPHSQFLLQEKIKAIGSMSDPDLIAAKAEISSQINDGSMVSGTEDFNIAALYRVAVTKELMDRQQSAQAAVDANQPTPLTARERWDQNKIKTEEKIAEVEEKIAELTSQDQPTSSLQSELSMLQRSLSSYERVEKSWEAKEQHQQDLSEHLEGFKEKAPGAY